MLLESKNVLVHAATGHVGSQVALRFAKEGARVWVAGRSAAKLGALQEVIVSAGGRAETIELDALDVGSIDRGTAAVVGAAGRLDAVFNAIAVGGPSGVIAPAVDMAPDTFLESFRTVVLSQFLTARAAARHMLKAGRGSVVLLTATPARGVAPLMAGHSAGHSAIEGLVKGLAAEWGPGGVRVTGLMSGGMPETPRIREVLSTMAAFAGIEPAQMTTGAAQKTLLRRMPTLDQTARVAAFLASDHAGSITGTIVNASSGEVTG